MIVDFRYLPDNLEEIKSSTKISSDYVLGTFLSKSFLIDTRTLDQLKQIIRNLQGHLCLVNLINQSTQFSDYKLIISEGVQQQLENEPSNNDRTKAFDGRLIAYQLVNDNGAIDLDKLFDLAVFIASYGEFDQIWLDYDTFNPDGELFGSLVVVMPTTGSDYNPNFSKTLITKFNGTIQSRGSLVEITNGD